MLNEYKNIYVYHGSFEKVIKPDLKHAENGKDFGKGFYLTTSKQQAIRFAKSKARKNDSKKAYLNIYELSNLNNIKVTEFKSANINWLECVTGYRDERYKKFKTKFDEDDVIIGKVADDQTALVLNTYLTGAYGDVDKKETKNLVIKLLLTNKLKDQICLKTEKALKKIKFVKFEEITL